MVPIGFIGTGNMAEAIIGGIIKKGIFSPQDIMAFDIVKERLDTLSSRFGIRTAPSAILGRSASIRTICTTSCCTPGPRDSTSSAGRSTKPSRGPW